METAIITLDYTIRMGLTGHQVATIPDPTQEWTQEVFPKTHISHSAMIKMTVVLLRGTGEPFDSCGSEVSLPTLTAI